MGIDQKEFANCFKNSGLVRNPNLTWIAFNSCFDFAYMVKLLNNNGQDNLPLCKFEFLKLCNDYFPNFYDVKQLDICTGSLKQ